MLHHQSATTVAAVGGPPPNEGPFYFGLTFRNSAGPTANRDHYAHLPYNSSGVYPQDRTNYDTPALTMTCGWFVQPDGGSSKSDAGFDFRYAQHVYDSRSFLLNNVQYLRCDLPSTPMWVRFHIGAGRRDGTGAIRSWGHEIYGTPADAAARTNVLHKVTGFDWTQDYSVVDAEGTEYPSTTASGQGRQDWVNESTDGGVGVPVLIPSGGAFCLRPYPDGTATDFTALMCLCLRELVD